jgi:ferrous iron transport protein A
LQEGRLQEGAAADSLATLLPGQSATIDSLTGDVGLIRRLKALGLSRGQRIYLLRRAWLAGPLHVRVGMTELMLRRVDATRIRISSPIGETV